MHRLTATVATALLLGTLATSAHAGARAAQARQPEDSGIVHMTGSASLRTTPSGAWTDTGLNVTLPRAGTYELAADVRGSLAGTPPIVTYITARLWNVSTQTAVPNSERLVTHIHNGSQEGAIFGQHATASIHERITVDEATTIALQAQRVYSGDTPPSIALIQSTSLGRTAIYYERLPS